MSGPSDESFLCQWDPRWGNKPYGNSNIAVSGCAPTSYAMIARHYGLNVTPEDVANFSVEKKHYPSPDGTRHSLFTDPDIGERFGVSLKKAESPDEVKQALINGQPVIAAHPSGAFTSSGHFMVYRGIKDRNEVSVWDPNRREPRGDYDFDFLVKDNKGGNENGSFDAWIPRPLDRWERTSREGTAGQK